MSEPIQDTNNTSPSALAPATVSTSSNSSRQSRAPPCTKCQRVYIRGKAEGQYDRFRDDQNAGREAGYLEGYTVGMAAAMKVYRDTWKFDCEWEIKSMRSRPSTGVFFKG